MSDMIYIDGTIKTNAEGETLEKILRSTTVQEKKHSDMMVAC